MSVQCVIVVTFPALLKEFGCEKISGQAQYSQQDTKGMINICVKYAYLSLRMMGHLHNHGFLGTNRPPISKPDPVSFSIVNLTGHLRDLLVRQLGMPRVELCRFQPHSGLIHDRRSSRSHTAGRSSSATAKPHDSSRL